MSGFGLRSAVVKCAAKVIFSSKVRSSNIKAGFLAVCKSLLGHFKNNLAVHINTMLTQEQEYRQILNDQERAKAMKGAVEAENARSAEKRAWLEGEANARKTLAEADEIQARASILKVDALNRLNIQNAEEKLQLALKILNSHGGQLGVNPEALKKSLELGTYGQTQDNLNDSTALGSTNSASINYLITKISTGLQEVGQARIELPDLSDSELVQLTQGLLNRNPKIKLVRDEKGYYVQHLPLE